MYTRCGVRSGLRTAWLLHRACRRIYVVFRTKTSGFFFTSSVRIAFMWNIIDHISLLWRHNELDSVSNHQPYDCLLNRLFRRRSNKTSKLRVTGLCVGNSPGPVNSPHKGPVTRKMFPFDDVIMLSKHLTLFQRLLLSHCSNIVCLHATYVCRVLPYPVTSLLIEVNREWASIGVRPLFLSKCILRINYF